MRITAVETIKTTKPIPLPGEYRAAWFEPDGDPVTRYGVSYCKITTDDGIVGFGPYSSDPDPYLLKCLIGQDPFQVESFWNSAMLGLDVNFGRGSYGGFDVALWDIIGKAAGLPVYKLLGSRTDKMMVYAATSRLCKPEEHVDQVQHIMSLGFKAVKLRLHRNDFREDLKVVQAVRKKCGDKLVIIVDANQNHRAINYKWWSRETARYMCRELEALNVYFFEEPLARKDYEGLAGLSREFDMLIAGGEHSMNIYEFREHIDHDTYDVFQPDVILGDTGITGTRKLAHVAEFHRKLIIPHVCGLGSFALNFAAMLQASATLSNCPMLEFPFDPPFLTHETQQFYLTEKFQVDADGYVALPQSPGIGAQIDEQALKRYQ